MTTEEEIEEFVTRNRDLIERMIEMQKGAAGDFVSAERAAARDAYGYARGLADESRARAEDFAHAAYSAFTDPDVQRHFVNMGLEFFMGMSALMEKAPMPGAVREGFRGAEGTVRRAACSAGECRRESPRKVNIVSDDRRDDGDVFKGCEDR